MLVWDATVPATPAQFTPSSGAPSFVTVTHLPQYDVSPGNGIGFVRVYQIAYIPNSGYDTANGGSIVSLNYSDPAFSGTPNYNDLWIYLPGEFSIVNGATPVFDRSDQYSLSNIYADRLTQNIGSIRAVDETACGGGCAFLPLSRTAIPAHG